MKKNDFLWNTLGLTFNAFVSLFFLVIINRINGIENAGIFSYCFSIACLFYVVALYYNRTYQVSDVEERYSNNQYITNRIISSIFVLIIIILFSFINRFNLFKSSILILITIYKILESTSDCFHAFIQKKNELYFVGQSLFFKAIVGVAGFLIIDLLTNNIIFSILWLLLTNICGLLIEIIRYNKLYKIKYTWTFSYSIDLYKMTLPLFLFSFLNIYINNSEKYILEYFMSEEYQTILGIIIMPATMLSLCGQYLISPYLNELSIDCYEKRLDKFSEIFGKINKIFIIICCFILIVAYLLGIPVLNLIYNVDLNSYKISFIIIIIGAIFYAMSTIISNVLVIFNKNKEQLGVFFISSLISTIFSIILIRIYGINGASIAYLITMMVHYALSCFLYKLCYNKIRNEDVL